MAFGPNPISYVLGTLGLMMGLLLLALPWVIPKGSFSRHYTAYLVWFGLGLLLTNNIWIAARIQKLLFPTVSFLIGDGKKRCDRVAGIRKNFGIGLLLAMAVGIVSGVIANSISK